MQKHSSTSNQSGWIPEQTLAEVFLRRAESSPADRVFLVKKAGSFVSVSWGEAHAQSLGIFASLLTLGIEKGDPVAILSNSRAEWAITDWTLQSLGAVTVPIYQSSTADEVAFVLDHSGAKLIFAEDAAQGAKLEKAFALLGRKLPVVFFAPVKDWTAFPCYAYETFSTASDPEAALAKQRASVASLKPSELASLVYTSGTTGKPKAACLLHSCFAAEIHSIVREVDLTQQDITLAFLPFSHVLGRIESLIPLASGITLAFAENVNAVSANMKEIKPTMLFSVPRIYEKMYSKILSEVESGSELKKRLFRWAVKTGRKVARLESDKKRASLALKIKHRIADEMVFSKIRQNMGGRLRFTISGGAPLAAELCEFFHACGIKILEGYGLSETTCAIAVNRPDDFQFSTVGRPIAETQFRIAEDGELQVKGPTVFSGYYNDDEATKEALTPDGWFCTGDIGEIDARGFVKITDRKKELIVTSGGKKVAPQKLENLLKQIPMVSNALVYGDKQKYLVGLVTLDERAVLEWSCGRELKGAELETLMTHPELRVQIEQAVKEINKSLASYESVKRIRLLPRDFTLEGGEITASMKLKRKAITEKYKAEIASLYA